jgi:hypothetical protein
MKGHSSALSPDVQVPAPARKAGIRFVATSVCAAERLGSAFYIRAGHDADDIGGAGRERCDDSHVFFAALPFGGVGASGMGHYHGEYGFRALCHAKKHPKGRVPAQGAETLGQSLLVTLKGAAVCLLVIDPVKKRGPGTDVAPALVTPRGDPLVGVFSYVGTCVTSSAFETSLK